MVEYDSNDLVPEVFINYLVRIIESRLAQNTSSGHLFIRGTPLDSLYSYQPYIVKPRLHRTNHMTIFSGRFSFYHPLYLIQHVYDEESDKASCCSLDSL